MNIVDIAVALNASKAYTDSQVGSYTPYYFTSTLTAADWASGLQTVTDNRITATGLILVDSDSTAYYAANIVCIAQAAGSLQFQAASTPTTDITVKIAVFG